jgi:hypothetical protein
VWFEVLFKLLKETWGSWRLEQAQLTGAGNGFRAPLYLQFVENPAVVAFDRVQGEKEPLANLLIRKSLGNEP